MGRVYKYLEIDNVQYPVKLVEVKRTVDTLDAQAYRTEDGVLHRKLIGIYMNYQVTVGIEDDLELYESLFDKLSAPVESCMIKLPNESVALNRYISSVQDGVLRVTDEGTLYKDLSFKITCIEPTRKP